MEKPLIGTKVAVLVANGFIQDDLTQCQRTLLESGAVLRIISVEQGIVNAWQGTGWGHCFAVDAALSTALGADFAALIVPGGHRSHDKLRLTAHTRRFIGSFMAAGKPVVMMNDAPALLASIGQAANHSLSAPEAIHAALTEAGATVSETTITSDANVLTALTAGMDEEGRRSFAATLLSHLQQQPQQDMDMASAA